MKIKTKRGAHRIRNQRVITRRFVTTDYTGCEYNVDHYTICDDGQIMLRLLLSSGIGVTTQMFNPRCTHGINFVWGVI